MSRPHYILKINEDARKLFMWEHLLVFTILEMKTKFKILIHKNFFKKHE